MNRPVFLAILVSLIGTLGLCVRVEAQTEPATTPGAVDKPLVLPLAYRSPGARALVIAAWGPEGEMIAKILLEHKIKVDRREAVDLKQQDYSAYHLIVGTSNVMDGYGYEQNPADFDPMERFVASGGHLLLFGTFNGRNSQNLQRFGITTGVVHAAGFQRVPGRSELLLNGFEAILPKEDKLTSAGNFVVSTPHVVLLQRGAQDAGPDQPAVVTLAYKKGRFTFTQVEPSWGDNLWLITVLGNWAVRGGPTSVEQLDEKVVLDEQALAQRRKALVPAEGEWQAAEETLRQKLRNEIDSAFTPEDKLKLATQLVQMSQTESSPAVSYAALQLARGFFAESSQPLNVFDAIRQMQAQFQIDTAPIALESLQTLAEKSQDPVSAVEYVSICLEQVDDLIDSEKFDTASTVLELAKSAAQIAKQKHFQSLITAQTKRLGVLQKEAGQILAAQETLKKTPESPEANQDLGKFYCFVLRDWDRGLPQLALGNDVALRQLAEGELKGTDDPAAQAILGDLWVAQARKLPVAMRAAAQSRAKTWYWHAMSKSSGAQKVALEKKSDKIVTGRFEIRFALGKCDMADLKLTRDRMVWSAKGTAPTSIEVNHQYWPVSTQGELKNRGATRYLPEDVNLETVELSVSRVRGVVDLKSVSPDELVLEIGTRDDSEFVLKFGP